jgi:hypothetical protein
MKTTVSILLCFLSVSSLKAQATDLTGTWTLFEMTNVAGQKIQKTTEDQLKANGSVLDLFFMEDAKFKQTSNMSGSGTVSTQEGTWKIKDNKLIITLQMGERKMDVDYTYEQKDNTLVLTRTSPDGNMKIIMACRKK